MILWIGRLQSLPMVRQRIVSSMTRDCRRTSREFSECMYEKNRRVETGGGERRANLASSRSFLADIEAYSVLSRILYNKSWLRSGVLGMVWYRWLQREALCTWPRGCGEIQGTAAKRIGSKERDEGEKEKERVSTTTIYMYRYNSIPSL